MIAKLIAVLVFALIHPGYCDTSGFEGEKEHRYPAKPTTVTAEKGREDDQGGFTASQPDTAKGVGGSISGTINTPGIISTGMDAVSPDGNSKSSSRSFGGTVNGMRVVGSSSSSSSGSPPPGGWGKMFSAPFTGFGQSNLGKQTGNNYNLFANQGLGMFGGTPVIPVATRPTTGGSVTGTVGTSGLPEGSKPQVIGNVWQIGGGKPLQLQTWGYPLNFGVWNQPQQFGFGNLFGTGQFFSFPGLWGKNTYQTPLFFG